MEKIRIAVVEDCDADYMKLKEHCDYFFKEKSVECKITRFTNAEDFLEQYAPVYDVVFMDIVMNGMDAMRTAKNLREIDYKVLLIFLTNMAQYALQGYEVSAFDYILKPLQYYSFSMKMDRVLHNLDQNRVDNSILIRADGRVKLLDSSKIRYLEIMEHDVCFHTEEGEFHTNGILKDFEEKLKGYCFSRCSACSLVNLKYVGEIYSEDVILITGERIHIGRTKKKIFLSDYFNYLNGEKRQ